MKIDAVQQRISELEAPTHVPEAAVGERARLPGRPDAPSRAAGQSSLEGMPPFQPQAARGPQAAARRLRLRRDRATTKGQLTQAANLIRARTRKKRS